MESLLMSSSDSNFLTVLKLLHDNGVDVRDGRKAYEELKKYERDKSFCSTLAFMFDCAECPVSSVNLPVSWSCYRRLAGITLKNNIVSAKSHLGEDILHLAGMHSLSSLRNPPDEAIVKVAAQIVVKITGITSFEWWSRTGMVDLATLLLFELLSSDELRCLGALYTLQYLIDDVPKQVGVFCETILEKVSAIACSSSNSLRQRRAAFCTCLSLFEAFQFLDWDVEILSPLQVSLTRASRDFMNTCSTLIESSCSGDVEFMSLVLCGCQVLVEYFIYLVPFSKDEEVRVSQVWIHHVAQIVSDLVPQNNVQQACCKQMLTEALRLFCDIIFLCIHSDGVEGNMVTHLGNTIVENIPRLSLPLVRYAHLSEEEVESILSSDDYRIRDGVGVSHESNVKSIDSEISERRRGDAVDEDVVALSLRCTALRFVAMLCMLDYRATIAALMPTIKSMWSSPDWKTREAAIVLLGTLGPSLNTEDNYEEVRGLVKTLINRALDASEGVCVKSITLWTLSRLLSPTSTTWDSAMHADVLGLWNSQLQSTSRRIQLTSVSAICIWLREAIECAPEIITADHVGMLLQSFYICAPVYTTRNLSLLVDMIIILLPWISNSPLSAAANVMEQLGGFVYEERTRRAKLFEESYSETFVYQHVHHRIVDKDIFSLDRALIELQRIIPAKSLGIDSLNTWNAVLQDMVARRVYEDDVELVSVTITLCTGYVEVVPTAALIDWLRQTHSSLTQHVWELLQAVRGPEGSRILQANHLPSDAINLLHRLSRSAGVHAAFTSSEMVDAMHVQLVSWYQAEEDVESRCAMARLMCSLVLSSTLTEAGMQSMCVISNSLRFDSIETSRRLYAKISAELTCSLQAHPVLIHHLQVDVICALLSDADINPESTEAIIRLFKVLATDLAVPVLRANGRQVLMLLIATEDVLPEFPELLSEVCALARFMHAHCAQQIEQYIPTLEPQSAQYLQRCIHGCA